MQSRLHGRWLPWHQFGDDRCVLLDRSPGHIYHRPLGVSCVQVPRPLELLLDVFDVAVVEASHALANRLRVHSCSRQAPRSDPPQVLWLNDEAKDPPGVDLKDFCGRWDVEDKRDVGNLVSELLSEVHGERSLGAARNAKKNDVRLMQVTTLRPVILFDRELDRFNSFEVFVAQRFPFRPHRSSWQPCRLLLQEGREVAHQRPEQVLMRNLEEATLIQEAGVQCWIHEGEDNERAHLCRQSNDPVKSSEILHVAEHLCSHLRNSSVHFLCLAVLSVPVDSKRVKLCHHAGESM
mmetsp:Transcript_16532/g.37746  ORF Transcript_16532/g.37746 Transcript_16532/m.37746 type:complete len:293 (-) Transcript_16532:568-1446(-)